MPLTPKQARFVAEYSVEQNATRAAIKAGYAESSAAVTGSQLLRNPKIAAQLANIQTKAVQRAQVSLASEGAVVTASRIIEEAARIAFGDIRDLVSWNEDSATITPSADLTPAQAAMLKEVRVQTTTTRNKDGSEVVNVTRDVKVWDKLSALNVLAKMYPSTFAPEAGAGNTEQHLHLHGLDDEQLRMIAGALNRPA